jgi:hypothetical protein
MAKINAKVDEEVKEKFEQIVDDSDERYGSGVLTRIVEAMAEGDRRHYPESDNIVEAVEMAMDPDYESSDVIVYDPDEDRDEPLDADEVKQILATRDGDTDAVGRDGIVEPVINPRHVDSTKSTPHTKDAKARMAAAILRYKYETRIKGRMLDGDVVMPYIDGDAEEVHERLKNGMLWDLTEDDDHDFALSARAAAPDVYEQLRDLRDQLENGTMMPSDKRLREAGQRVERLSESPYESELMGRIVDEWGAVRDAYKERR